MTAAAATVFYMYATQMDTTGNEIPLSRDQQHWTLTGGHWMRYGAYMKSVPIQDLQAAARVSIGFNDAAGRHEITVTEGGAARHFLVDLRVCDNPCCHCQSVELVCFSEHVGASGEAAVECIAQLDLHRRSMDQHRAAAPPDDQSFSRVVAAGIDDDGWRLLTAGTYEAKREQMQSMDLDLLEADFPPAVMDGSGAMTGYSEIFPFAEGFTIATDGGEWLVDDQYCINPKCSCHDVGLTFLPALCDSSPVDDPAKQREFLTIQYDYRKGSCTVLHEPSMPTPSSATLMAALQQAYPDSDATLKERRRQLRYLFLRTQRRERQLESAASSTEQIGRNAPCPCGSGKKFKRCCG